MAPMQPNLKKCHKPPKLPPYAEHLSFCPPNMNEEPRIFKFPNDLAMRTRRAAHKVDDNYRAKYAVAVQLMKNLPPEDPRNFIQQANIHCAYCTGAYNMGETDKPFKVHANWFFLPWHRWFLYFHERILAKLIGDDTFALPFWNWDHEDGMTVPRMYGNQASSLFNNKRNLAHTSNGFMDLGFSYKKGYSAASSSTHREDLIRKNYKIMHNQIVTLASTTRTFHGEAIREDSPTCKCGAGTLENKPHNTVHDWTGSVQRLNAGEQCVANETCYAVQTCYGEDMGILYSAARDPIFYAHHANVDRMWTIWKTLPERKDYDDQALLDTRFYFYDENARLVEVRAGDAFDLDKLCYEYEVLPTPWLQPTSAFSVPTVPWHAPSLPADQPTADVVPTLDLSTDNTFRKPVKIVVMRNPREAVQELLVIEGIRVQRDITVKFDVFVQLDDSQVAQPYVSTVPTEYVGSYVELVRGPIDDDDGDCGQSSMRVVISKVLQNLGVGLDKPSIVVTLIPKVDLTKDIQISAVKMEYE